MSGVFDAYEYTSPIIINKDTILKFMVVLNGNNSNVATNNYVVRSAHIRFNNNASETRYIKAYSDNAFMPDKVITRYEVIESLANLLDIEKVDYTLTLSDLKDEYKDVIELFIGAGIINGYEDGTFKGEEGLTRAEFIKIMSIILNLEEVGEVGIFSDTNGHWALKYISSFEKLGYVKGYEDGTFRPDNKMTRAEFVTLVNRIVKVSIKEVTETISDLNKTHWAYEDIMTSYIK